MEKLGTNYGGWIVPTDIKLDKDSIVYSCGVGEDISFDILLSHKINPFIYLIDPTKRAKTHFEEAKKFFTNKEKFTGNIQTDYYKIIENCNPNFEKITYIDMGVWKEKDNLKFYLQTNPNYVSQSLIIGMFGENFYNVPVDTIKNIMCNNRHNKIDLLKLDIEGAEVCVLEKMLDDNIKPRYICVEFDLYLKNKDTDRLTQKLLNRLERENYKILADDNYNITFEHKNE